MRKLKQKRGCTYAEILFGKLLHGSIHGIMYQCLFG